MTYTLGLSSCVFLSLNTSRNAGRLKLVVHGGEKMKEKLRIVFLGIVLRFKGAMVKLLRVIPSTSFFDLMLKLMWYNLSTIFFCFVF